MSALIDRQLDDESTERAWKHVMQCPSCRRQVEREGWVKRQLAEMAGSQDDGPSSRLVGSLYDLAPAEPVDSEQDTRDAWAAVDELERRSRGRRRAGIAAVGVGSVSAAVIGFSALGGAPLGIGGGAGTPPTTALTRTTPTSGPLAELRAPVRPRASVTGPSSFVPFSGWSVTAPTEATAAVFRTGR